MSTTYVPRSTSVAHDVVVREAVLDGAPAKVWRALTQPEIVADWSGATGFDPRPGSRFAISPEADRPAIDCEILAADPPHGLSYMWREETDGDRRVGRDSIVTFELSPMGPDRTHLRIVHRLVVLTSRPRPLAPRRSISRMATTSPARAAPMRLAA